MRLIPRLLFLTLVLGLVGPALRAADAIELSALLVSASKEPGASDPRLKPYEATLRRILRFESFKLVGQGQTSLQPPGKGNVSLGAGHSLQIEAESNAGGSERVQVSWQQGGRTLMRSGLVLRPGVPAVLGGPGTGEGGNVYAVIVIAR
ncbi:MAG TPA: hypothetical protein PKX00_09570 [Opitutaceae bacterium]|nr:hypothetical protein [Opitutaceae bacterium]